MAERIRTALGPELVQCGDHWELDLSTLSVFRGLSVLSSILSDEILDHVENTPGDIGVFYKVNPNINPQLVDLGIVHIQVYARTGVLTDSVVYRESFHGQLTTVFGTFQRATWAARLCPEAFPDTASSESHALVFAFNGGSQAPLTYVLERVMCPNRAEECFLRLTIDHPLRAEAAVRSIAHCVVDDLDSRTYIAGSTRIAESINTSIHIACHKGRQVHGEEYRPYSPLFEQLEKTPLGRLDGIQFYWDSRFGQQLLDHHPSSHLPMLKKLFLSLEDQSVIRLLNHGATIHLGLEETTALVDLSHLDRVLNFSFNKPRPRVSMASYLARLPSLALFARDAKPRTDFHAVNIFLVHHITFETVAFLEALFSLRVATVWTAFVKYGGHVPPSYLDTLLDVPTERLCMAALERQQEEHALDYYGLSDRFSDTGDLEALHAALEAERLDFGPAMERLAGHLFLKFARQSEREGKRVLLIEDGGYVAPHFNRYAAAGMRLHTVLSMYHVGVDVADDDFGAWYRRTTLGTVEHTRNGYNRLAESNRVQPCIVPAFSIAISRLKTEEESKEVAHSVLNAVESILYAQGLTLSARRPMVLGAAGNIGTCLCRYLLHGKLHEDHQDLVQIDSAYVRSDGLCFPTISEAPESLLLNRDLFLGVIGESILTEELIVKLLVHGNAPRLFFASGSTKTLEFTHLIAFLRDLGHADAPRIGNHPVELGHARILDPQTGLDQGGLVTLKINTDRGVIRKDLYLLGDLSPVNFLYYGVPSERMDGVMAQLARLSLGVVGLSDAGTLPESGLYAVDHEVDEWGRPLQAQAAEQSKAPETRSI